MDKDIKTVVDIILSRPKLRSAKLLAAFVQFAMEHSDYRFWQAIRNWCGWAFVFVTNHQPILGPDKESVIWRVQETYDTFYWEDNHQAPKTVSTGIKISNGA